MMACNFSWSRDGAGVYYYLPSDKLNTKNPYEAKMTKEGKKIVFLKDSPLPENLKPYYETIELNELQEIKRMFAQAQSKAINNHEMGFLKLSADIFRMIAVYLNPAEKAAFAHTSYRLKEVVDYHPESVCSTAIEKGQRDILMWGLKQAFPCDAADGLTNALGKQEDAPHYSIIFWILERARKSEDPAILESIKAMKPFLKKRLLHPGVFFALMKEGRSELVSWLIDPNNPLNFKSCIDITDLPWVDILYYALRFNLGSLLKVIDKLDILFDKSLVPPLSVEGPPLMAAYRTVMENAAFFGRLEFIQNARSRGIEINENVSLGAAEGGHVVILEWLLQNKLPISQDAASWAARKNQTQVIAWLEKNLK